MNISCPRCGSTQLERQPGLAESGWRCLKAAVFVLLVSMVLPISLVFHYTNVIVLVIAGLCLIGGLFLATWAFQRIVRQQPATLDWKCQVCKKEFETSAKARAAQYEQREGAGK